MIIRVCNRCKTTILDGKISGVHINEIKSLTNKLLLNKDIDLCGECYYKFLMFLDNKENNMED